MKNIAAQMVNFDREQMRRIANNMPEQYDEKPQVQQVAQIINGVFSQLLATFPASLANRDQNELNEIRRQWVLAFRENGLIWFTSIAGSEACIRMQSLIRGNRTRTTGWLPTCTRTCGPMR
ncbi:Replication protein P [Shigella sonnei]|nr:Replication protein P [Shigella sonnei]